MLGNLYIITNNINNKIYIGKTYTDIEQRWRRHISDAFRTDRENNSKFYNALRKYGPEHFKIELIARFEEGMLEQKEIEYISKYDSYNNGYNSTLGGDGNPTKHIDEQLVVDLYKQGVTLNAIAKELSLVSTRRISNIIKNNNLNLKQQTKVIVEQYDIEGNLLNKFDSKMDAWRWLVNNYKSDIKRNTAYYYIKRASEGLQEKAFGYKWKQYETDIVAINENSDYNSIWYCDAYDSNGNKVINYQKVVDVAKLLIHNNIVQNDNIKTVSRTIIDHNKNHIYGLYWKVYKLN